MTETSPSPTPEQSPAAPPPSSIAALAALPPPPGLALTADDEAKARALAVMKRRATGLLVVFAGIFAVAKLLEARFPWLAVVRATAEAAMVGGLADWFAVTALFKQPLGLPIPHTAIVKTRKERIGRSLGNFVQHNFLARAVIARHLAGLHVATRLAEWASHPDNARRIARQIAGGLARAVDALPDDEVRDAIHASLVSRGRKTQVAPILGDVLSLVAADGRHQVLLDQVLRLVDRAVEDNKDLIRERIASESPWWVPTAIDDKLYQKIVAGVERMLDEVRAQPHHPMRTQFDKVLGEFIESLRTSPEVIARAEAMKERLLEQPVVHELTDSVWESARRSIAKYASPEAPSPAPLERTIITLAESLLENHALRHELDEALCNVALGVIEQHRTEVGALIARTVAEWDADAAALKIEVAVGRDLQFIRINGTLVGGLVGLLLFLLSAGVDRLTR
ncbi:MAG TPA: DUF445 domain-containing protein [Gemmatimonadaceae bacterium]|nr:DUF445 domain-containing protein [Gemmatimonadaceae bacterium]